MAGLRTTRTHGMSEEGRRPRRQQERLRQAGRSGRRGDQRLTAGQQLHTTVGVRWQIMLEEVPYDDTKKGRLTEATAS